MYPDENIGAVRSNQCQPKANYENAGCSPDRAWTPLEQMQERSNRIEQEFSKLSEGIQFLRENPQFNRFIELIRKGSIGI